MQKYKNIFFDLDNTLWDFTQNSRESLKEIFENYNFKNEFENFQNFYTQYEKNNNDLWNDYRQGNISKETLISRRFLFAAEKKIFSKITPIQLNAEYLTLTTKKTKIIENARQILRYLSEKYTINIITDGFFEIQIVKLRGSKLSPFILNVITAEEIGILKPNKEIFEFAIEQCQTTTKESIMIGDSYQNDIIGAHNAGINQIFFNPNNQKCSDIKPTHTIKSLIEIKNIL